MNGKNLRALGTYGFLVLMIIFFGLTTHNFFTFSNLINILIQITPVVIAASAVTLLMVSGSLDLSVGGVLALSGVVSAGLASTGMPLILAFAGGVAIGLVVGLVNGALVVGLGINPVIATLGTLYATTGAAWLLTGGSTSVAPNNEAFADLGTGRIGPIPVMVIVMAVTVALFVFLERRTLLGKYSVAIGSNFEGSRLAGVKVNFYRVLLFMLAGVACGIAGIINASQLSGGQPSVGSGFEFAIIVAAVVGGVSLAGGRGTVLGTLGGAAIIGVIHVALNLNFVDPFWQQIIEGILLVGVVAIDVLLARDFRRPQWLSFRTKQQETTVQV